MCGDNLLSRGLEAENSFHAVMATLGLFEEYYCLKTLLLEKVFFFERPTEESLPYGSLLHTE